MYAEFHDADGTRRLPESDWEALITTRGYAAVVFDCDGTLVESADAHFRAFQDAVAAQGEVLDRDWYRQRTGLDRHSLLSEFADAAGPGFDVPRAVADSIAAFGDHVHLVRPIPRMADLLMRVSSLVPVAVGTNAETAVASASLTATGLSDAIRLIVSISDGLPPKPSPDIFATAARRLQVQARDTLVIEDSTQGVAAARAAGMDVLLVRG
ncbi:HAD family hydrolase [Pseudaestuariivita atlantica]|uniref:Phosphatase n=1 Tax=Pseudaestuariivita atlantica TaxID=1317121 RepID=A0A0L1JQA7_9RHOB|nr:HAD family phosphatase [Pseudaestuariivita atlantica]KNG93939.1 hypothetical protein ATO11_06605 [Pseudaestuariivita atlantica]